MKKGPVVLMTLAPSGSVEMGRSLSLWFLYSVVVSLFDGLVYALFTAGTFGWLWPR